MFAHISTNLKNPKKPTVELAIVNAEGSVLFSRPIRNFFDVSLAYRHYRHEHDPTMPAFVDIEGKLRRQWNNLNQPSVAERAIAGAIAA